MTIASSRVVWCYPIEQFFHWNDSEIYIITIQRLYSILKESELDERDEEENPARKNGLWK